MAMPIAGEATLETGSGYTRTATKSGAGRSGEGLGAVASDVITVTVDNFEKTVSPTSSR